MKIEYSDRVEWRNKKRYLHRVDGPAIEWISGHKEWYLNGVRHRVDGPAIDGHPINGSKVWWFNGKLHREGGPAIERINGDKEWWQSGNRHRLDGPAIELISGIYQWWIDGCEFYSEEEWFKALDKDSQIAYLFNMGK